MSEKTGIEWTDHTFNPWSGCVKVSPACTNCYAAALPPSMRRGAEWGANTARVVASESYWQQPHAWDRAAATTGVRRRVFCASVADVFEARDDLDEHRAHLFELIDCTPHLDWLLLTKRPEEMVKRAPERWARGWPKNVWAGTTVEDQRRADERVPHLLNVPAKVRFLSCEPLLGPVDLTRIPRPFEGVEHAFDALDGRWRGRDGFEPGYVFERISWVIAGGESGRRARPSHPDWFRSLRDQCEAAGVPFFFKQWGEWANADDIDAHGVADFRFTEQYPEDGGVPRHVWRDAPIRETARRLGKGEIDGVIVGGDTTVYRVGKKAAGRLLDGVEWSQFPEVA